MKTKLQKRRRRTARKPDNWPEWPLRGVIGDETMGRFAVEVEVANSSDVALAEEGKLSQEKVLRETIRGVIDPGASRLVMTESVVEREGLPRRGRTKVKYADGRSAWRDNVYNAWVSLQGRESTCVAIVEPKRDTALIGAIVLEDLDFLVDCKNQRLVPRDPKAILNEIE
jgi:predicted aspartyl protease